MTHVRWFVAFLLLPVGVPGQSLQYRSPAGMAYHASGDTTAIVRARTMLAADPRNVDLLLALGLAEAGAQRYREAIGTFTRGLVVDPNNAVLYRWRGHRYLSVREYARAEADLRRGLAIDRTTYGCWYHLGIVRFVQGDFAGAADAFRAGLPFVPNAGELKGSVDWLWMSLARAGRHEEAQALLDQHLDTLETDPDYAYTRRVRLYRGQVAPEALITASDTAGVQVATLSFGLGNWYLVRGDTARALEYFRRAVATTGWAGFGFIVSEVELRRLAAPRQRGAALPKSGTDRVPEDVHPRQPWPRQR